MKTSIFIFTLLISFSVFGQKDCNEFTKNYIPVDLTDAINYLDCIWTDSEKNDFKVIPENGAVNDYYRNYRIKIMNNWGLLNGNSELYNYCLDLGLTHPFDMSHLILSSYHRHLNNKDLEIKKKVKQYNYFRFQKEVFNRKLKDSHFPDFNINDTVYFKYKLGFASRDQKQFFFQDSCDAIGIVTEKNPTNLELKVKLLNSCDSLGVIIAIEDIYEKKELKVLLIEENKKFYMKEGEEKWTFYDLWQKND